MICLLLLLVVQPPAMDKPSAALAEVIEAERAFAAMAKREGVSPALLHHLAEDGLIFRPEPTPGKKLHREKPLAAQTQLQWEPKFATVSSDGNLGFTTGPYSFRARPDGDASHGHYVTVWRKLSPCWRAVIDLGISHPSSRDSRLTWLEPPSKRSVHQKSEESETELCDLEMRFGTSEATEAEAYRAIAHEQLRWYRAGKEPAVGREAALKQSSSARMPPSWRPSQVVVDHDLAYSHGQMEYQIEGRSQKWVYVHIYRKENAWRLLLDIALPTNQGR